MTVLNMIMLKSQAGSAEDTSHVHDRYSFTIDSYMVHSILAIQITNLFTVIILDKLYSSPK